MSRGDGGPAFPHTEHHHDGAHYFDHGGMTLRDYFAAKAMQAALAAGRGAPMRNYQGWRDELAREAYRYADAMLAAREGGAL